MFEAAKRYVGVLGCLVAVASCGASANPKDGSPGTGGAAAGASGGAGGAGASVAGAGGVPSPGAGGAGGDAHAPGAAGVGAPGSDAATEGGSAAGAAGAGGTAGPADAGLVPDGGAGATLPRNVLIFTRSTNAYVHESKLPGAMAVKTALAALGITAQLSEDTTLFTPAGLAPFGAIVLVSTTGKPLGDPGTAALAALRDFVRAGGGLAALHAATATTYDVTLPYVPLLGAREIDHPGGIRTATCYPKGTHPAVAQLPPSFSILDEIFTFDNLRPDLEIDVECLATDGKTRLPIAWHHTEGAGRVFTTAFGHGVELWTPDGILLKQHFIPGILWTLGV